MTIPPPTDPGGPTDESDDPVSVALEHGRAVAHRLQSLGQSLGRSLRETLPVDDSEASPADGGTGTTGRGVSTPDVLGLDVPSLRPSRRTLLAALGGAAVGAAAASPNEVGSALAGLNLGGRGLTVDPAATAGPGHEHALALVPEDEATHVATSSGTWASGGTWDEGVPSEGARVHIPAGKTVTVASQLSDDVKTVRVDGTLRFHRSKDATLRAETIVTTPGSLLDVGHPGEPIQPDAEARITFSDLGPIDEDWDPGRRSKGLLTMGAVSVHGTEKTTWTALANDPRSGDRTLELPEAPTNWRLGDRIVVPGNHPVENQDEEAVVTAVDGPTVELDRTLDHDHVPPADDLDSYVVNLSRNVRFDSENSDTPRRGHVMFMADEVDVRYAGAYKLGRTDKSYAFTNNIHGEALPDVPPNPRARYAMHFHETGIEGDDPGRIHGVAVDDSPGWGIVNHHSHVEVTDSVTYDVFGAGFVAEAGNERGAFRRNFALRSTGSGDVPDARRFLGDDREGHVDDFGHGGHGFWLQGPTVHVEDNVVAGHRHYGFVFWNRPLVDRELGPGEHIDDRRGTVQNFPVEYVDLHEDLAESEHAAAGMISSARIPIQAFRNNTAFASGGGLDVSRHMFGSPHTRYDDYGLVEGFTAYDIGPLVRGEDRVVEPDSHNAEGGNNGITIRYSHNVRVRDARLIAGQDAEMEAATRGVGINRNTPYPFNVVVEDSEVRGWGRGIQAMTRGTYVVRTTILSNRTNVVVDEHDGGPDRRIALEDLTVERGPAVSLDEIDLADTYPKLLFSTGQGIELDGRHVYLDAQAPEAVPVPDENALETLGHVSQLEALTDGDPVGVVGKSNRELLGEYGIAVHGAVAPPDAATDSRVEGGLLGPSGDGSPPRTVWLEAEEGVLESPFVVETDESASGGEYVVPRGVDSDPDEAPSGGYATYTFEVAAGEYRFHGRVQGRHWSDDSFWVRVDRGPWHRWDGVRTDSGWEWHPVWDSEDDDDPLTVDLDRGEHRLQIAFREDGTKLDKLLVSALDTTPVWMGDPLVDSEDPEAPTES